MAADARPATATGSSPPTAASSPSATPRFYGSTGAITSTSPIVGMAATPDRHGYWLVASDGGIFTFGDAALLRLDRRPSTSTSRSSAWPPPPTGSGYWLVASDGGIFTFGDAPLRATVLQGIKTSTWIASRDPHAPSADAAVVAGNSVVVVEECSAYRSGTGHVEPQASVMAPPLGALDQPGVLGQHALV